MNISASPDFVAKGDFHLRGTSAAIDAAASGIAPVTDLDGGGRHGPPDMGCFEFNGVGVLGSFAFGSGNFTVTASGARGTAFTIETSTNRSIGLRL